MKLTLPYPPSANSIWRNIRGRTLISREARDYKATVALICKTQRLRPLDGPVALSLDVYRPRQRGDLGNRLKLLEDSLQGFAYANDEQVAEIHMRRHEDKANPRVEVEVVPA